MKIMIVTAMFPPIRTGTSHYSMDLAQSLHKRGHEISVVTLKNKDAHDEKYPFPVHRVRSLHFQIKDFFKHFRTCALFPQNYYRMWRIVRRHDPDVIYLVNHYLDIAFLAVFAKIVLRKPLVCSVHTQIQSIFPWRDRLMNFFDRLICGGMIFRFCDKIISVDKHIELYLAEIHGPRIIEKSVIVPYGVSGDSMSFLKHEHDYSLHGQMTGVGAVIQQRNYVSTVRSFHGVLKRYPELRLKIIGHVYYDEAPRLVRELGIQDNVSFVGEMPHDKVLEELNNSDVFFGVATGKYNGLGTACIEAMLLGVPTVANVDEDVFGEKLIHDMENCVTTEPLNPQPTSEKLLKLLDDRALRENVGRNGRKLVKENLGWEHISEQLEKLLRDSLATP